MLLPVSYDHDPVCVGNVVLNEDVCMPMIALVWVEGVFELPDVSSGFSILVCQLIGERWGDIVPRGLIGG